ncbi:MAG: hypothetical protein HYY42_04350 [Chloroflexi bacterium]|nr:hypothetical protein [Chloroflexota bacterium]MBI2983395.1 hypothetical protein [Chloroflexota bacterium]
MAVVLLPRPAFVRAVNERLAWLAENRSEDQIDNFLAGLNTTRERIANAPEAGPIVKEDAEHALRMRLFPRPLPYLVYYGHAHGAFTEVYLVRLYGSGQDREDIDMSGWPW